MNIKKLWNCVINKKPPVPPIKYMAGMKLSDYMEYERKFLK